MKKWLFFLAVFSSAVACGEQDPSDEESFDVRAQVSAPDAGTRVTPTADGGGASTGAVGSACVANTDCKAAGTTCLKELTLPFGTITMPGGLCTKGCKADRDCTGGGACPLAALESFLPGVSQCLAPCKVAADCREGYRCAASSFGSVPGFGAAAPTTAAAAATYCLPPSPGGAALPAGGFPPPGGGAR